MTDDDAYMNEEVDCPWCSGHNCPRCDYQGTIPRWVFAAITTDGEVR